ncbi:MAG: DUF4405 domain-containing protein [Gloeobacteraceae cyanobacterium ES-bin-144]|nr:DUF4405 domain-containing protein [Verrucomicrobiales bacterium]
MNRGLLNLLIDLVAAFCLGVMLATGYILRFPLPPTTNRTHELWGMSRHEWGTIHFWVSLLFLAVLLTHVILHWEWLFATIRRRFTKLKAPPHQRYIAGIATALALLAAGGLFAWAAHSGVRATEVPLHPLREPETVRSIPQEQFPAKVDFQRDVMPIFEASCIDCHGSKRQRAGLRVDRRADFFAPGDKKPLIVPGRSDTSRLIDIVSGEIKDMKSAEEHRLPVKEITILKTWIDSGADWP